MMFQIQVATKEPNSENIIAVGIFASRYAQYPKPKKNMVLSISFPSIIVNTPLCFDDKVIISEEICICQTVGFSIKSLLTYTPCDNFSKLGKNLLKNLSYIFAIFCVSGINVKPSTGC